MRIKWGGLRTKIVVWTFVPTAIILTIVALVGFYAYQQVTQDLTIQSSRELARLSAGQVAAELSDYSNALTNLARTAAIYAHNPTEQRAALAQAANRLVIFDGGVLILNNYGTVVATQPERSEIVGQDWSSREYFKQMVRVPSTVVSNVVSDGPGGAQVVVVAVPVTNARGELVGTLAGMFRVGATSVSSLYGSIVKLRFGVGRDTYLVDHNGLVLYHTDSDWIGKSLGTQPAVQQVTSGKADAVRTIDPDGHEIVASFAPVPGTPWGWVNEADWESLLAAGRSYQQFLLLLLALGLIVPTLVVTFGVQRITGPIAQLVTAAKGIAGGNFGQQIAVHTGDELEELVTQFNVMSHELSESYAQLEQRVAARTQELTTLNAIAGVVSSSLDLKAIMNVALVKAMEAVRMEVGTAYSVASGDQLEDRELTLAARVGLTPEFSARIGARKIGGTAIHVAAEAQQPVVWRVDNYPDLSVKHALELEGVRQVINVPLSVKGKLVGVLNLGTQTPREIAPEEVALLGAIGQQVGIAVENSHLYERAEESAALAERQRLSRELHDSVTQQLYSVTLYAEAASRLLNTGDTDTAAQHLGELRDIAQEALRDMRLLIFELRPLALDKVGLAAALRTRLDAVELRGGIQTALRVDGIQDPEKLSHAAEEELYHIGQEALNNVLKHSHAQHVHVHLCFAGSDTSLEIVDDGVGYEAKNAANGGGGLGLASLKERAEKIGGALAIESAPNNGTRIQVCVPAKTTNKDDLREVGEPSATAVPIHALEN